MAKLYKLELSRGYPQDQHHRAGLVLQRGGALITELSKDQLEAVKNDHYITLSEAKDGEQTTAPDVSADGGEGAGVADTSAEGADAPDRSASEDAPSDEDQHVESEEAPAGEAAGEAEQIAEDEAVADSTAAQIDAPADDAAAADNVAEDEAAIDSAAAQIDQASDESASDDAVETADSLVRDHSREELNKIALDAGVENPDKLENKPAVAAAIIEKRG